MMKIQTSLMKPGRGWNLLRQNHSRARARLSTLGRCAHGND
jgi:hypothetical protein